MRHKISRDIHPSGSPVIQRSALMFDDSFMDMSRYTICYKSSLFVFFCKTVIKFNYFFINRPFGSNLLANIYSN